MKLPTVQRLRQGKIKPWQIALVAVLLWVGWFPADVFSGPPPDGTGPDGQYSGKQGQIIVVKVPSEEASDRLEATFLGRTVNFFPETRADEPNGFVGLVGIDLQDKPGMYELKIQIMNGEHSRSLSYPIRVLKEKFRVERLRLPKNKVDLDKKSLARWKREQQQVKQALADDSPEKLWQPSFVEPVNGRRTGIFGSVRIMNGQARNPHNGEDIGAPMGADVAATNDGIVRLTVDHIFSGKGVFLDHGLGLYSMYFHLSEVSVNEGDLVRAGQIVGKVGATGRATGPHLHWGVKLNGARVNPYALLDLPFKGVTQAAIQEPTDESVSAVGEPSP